MRFSIITPTFNRRDVVRRSIDSGLQFVRAVGNSEIVVIDDASKDGTVGMLRNHYVRELRDGLIKLVAREENGGSTVAKSDGARNATGDWLIFLDSDDELLPEAATAMPNFIGAHRDAKVFLFRCIDTTGRLIGPPMAPQSRSLFYLLTVGTPGECLPVLSRTAFLKSPADNDPMGFEFLSTLRVVQAFGPAVLSDAVTRRYYTSHHDRLTSRLGNLRRAKSLVSGLSTTLREFGAIIPLSKRLGIFVRIICYSLIAAFAPRLGQKR
jgi:glycosyltransferase involved in cell wall biosynthesis